MKRYVDNVMVVCVTVFVVMVAITYEVYTCDGDMLKFYNKTYKSIVWRCNYGTK